MAPATKKRQFGPRYAVPLVEQITEFLTQAILDGQFRSGDRLVETGLQKQFRVSRSPIRESFRVLEKKGLVTNVPRKGTYVRNITQKDIEENFPVRANLESLAACLALPHLTDQDLGKMEILFSRMEQAAQANDFKAYLKHHLQFHDIFILASRNDTLIDILNNLRSQALWFRYSYLYIQESFDYAIKVHRSILGFFRNKEAEKLEALVKEHILIALNRFIQFLESQR